MKQLVLFTLHFPFGKGEAFLENELPILADYFDKVIIFPTKSCKGSMRELPKNVSAIKSLSYKPSINVKTIFIALPKLLYLFFWTIAYDRKPLAQLIYFKSFIDYALQDLAKFSCLKQIILSRDLKNALFYDYWLVNQNLSLGFLKRAGIITKLITRAHRFDLYDEDQFEGIVSFKKFRLKNVNRIYLISKHGLTYLRYQYPQYREKMKLSYLGVNPNPFNRTNKRSEQKNLLLVSCSRILDFKRVHEIPELLKECMYIVKWVHFGDGPLKEKVMLEIKGLPRNISVEFKGEVSNDSILHFYKTNFVDGFISLSISEGLPVSMMEAIQYGIPIFARACNGVNEILNSKTGILSNGKVDEGSLFNFFLSKTRQFNRDEIIEFARAKFNSKINYRKFIEDIGNI